MVVCEMDSSPVEVYTTTEVFPGGELRARMTNEKVVNMATLLVGGVL